MSHSSESARVRLVNLPTAMVHVPNAGLPLVMFDPSPDMTLALHALWAAMRPFIGFSADRNMFFRRPNGRNAFSVGHGFAEFGPQLVCPELFFL